MRPARLALALLLLLLGAGAAGAQTPAPPERGLTLRLLDAPVERKDDPRALVYVVDHLNQGEAITRRIEVTNHTSGPLTAQLYAGSAHIDPVNGWVVDNGRSTNDLTSWTTIDPAVVELAPGAAKELTLRIAVPQTATDGERYAAVLAELPARAEGNVLVTNRVGIRMYLDIGSGNEPASDFRVDTLTAGRTDDGRPVIKAKVVNVGGRAIDLTGSVSLTEGPGGVTAGPFSVPTVRTLGIGQTGDVVLPLDPALPAGPWKATLTMKSGEVERAVEATLTFPASGDGVAVAAKPVSALRNTHYVYPVAIGLVSLLALGTAYVAWLGARRRRTGVDDEELLPVG
jgi:hypothetical protein